MQTAIYLTLLFLGIFIYARICRDHRIYSKLLFCSIVAFLIGSCIKSKAVNISSINYETVITAQNPTSYSLDTAVVWTVSEDNSSLSQDNENDTVMFHKNFTKQETINRKETIMRRNNIDIQNDS